MRFFKVMAKRVCRSSFKCFTISVIFFIGFILIPTLSQNQNGQNFGGNQNIPGFTPFIVNGQPFQQSVQGQGRPQFQQNPQFQQQPGNNQQFQPQPPQNIQQLQPQPPQNNPQLQPHQPQNNQPQQTQNNQPIQPQQPQQNTNSDNQSMSESCLACICQASTNCKLATPCMTGGQYCGPFLISKPYWIDSGMPTLIDDVPEREGAFEDCAIDPICAAQTVRKYMNKFRKDCNGDGKIDCEDLTRIHLMGPFDCTNPKVTTTVFYRKFKQCWNRVLQLSV